MKTKRRTKLFIIFLTLIFSIQFFGCDFIMTFLPTLQPEELVDAQRLTDILSFNLAPTLQASSPDGDNYSEIVQTTLGVDLSNQSESGTESYTYLVEYGEQESGYILIYILKDLVPVCIDELENYARTAFGQSQGKHFSAPANACLIDGKYLFAFSRTGLGASECIKMAWAQDARHASFYLGEDYQLVLALKARTERVVKNLSLGTCLNVDRTVYTRVPLWFSDVGKTPRVYDYKGDWVTSNPDSYEYEGLRQAIMDEEHEYIGQRIRYQESTVEQGEPRYQTGTYGVGKVFDIVEENGSQYVALPDRRILSGMGISILGQDIPTEYDLYEEHKELFAQAWVGALPNTTWNAHWGLGLFDFEAICSIILRSN